MTYYLEGVDWTARQTIAATTELLALFAQDRERVLAAAGGRATLATYEALQRRVIVSIRRLAEATELSIPSVTSALRKLEQLEIVREVTGRAYGRLFAYDRQLEILNRS
jgi:DNA-binding transcriptional ArsR family regulator